MLHPAKDRAVASPPSTWHAQRRLVHRQCWVHGGIRGHVGLQLRGSELGSFWSVHGPGHDGHRRRLGTQHKGDSNCEPLRDRGFEVRERGGFPVLKNCQYYRRRRNWLADRNLKNLKGSVTTNLSDTSPAKMGAQVKQAGSTISSAETWPSDVDAPTLKARITI